MWFVELLLLLKSLWCDITVICLQHITLRCLLESFLIWNRKQQSQRNFNDILLFYYLFLKNTDSVLHNRSPIGRSRGRERGRGRGTMWGVRDPGEPNSDWCEEYKEVQVPDFDEQSPAPAQRFPNNSATRERNFFDALFTNNIWEILAWETNKYFDQCKAVSQTNTNDPGPLWLGRKWKHSLELLFWWE